jgi:Rrf2 family protein
MGKDTQHRLNERSSLMNIGRRVDYAVRALSYLAAQPLGQIVSRREIQMKQDIPAHFLSKIMKRLASGGFVQSYMGTRGGFTLKKSASEVNLKDVYECLEGPLLLMECLGERERVCRYCAVCNQISVWHEAQQLLANYLSRVSLLQIADKTGLRAELAHWEQKSTKEQLPLQTFLSERRINL